MIFIGIDPGVSGAIAVLNGSKIQLFDMPLLPKEGKFNRHDPAKLFAILKGAVEQSAAIAVVEKVHFDRRDDGKKGSAEVLIRSHEAVLTCLSILEVPTLELYPPQWRKISGSSQCGTDETLIVQYAISLFPEVRDQLKRRSSRAKAGYVYHHNRAEALLMAHAGRELSNNVDQNVG